MKSTAESGFSLAFVVILITLAGIAAATLMVSSQKDAHWNPLLETHKKLEKIQEALIAFQRTNKYLPCPAPLNVNSSNAAYGIASPANPAACAGSFAHGAVPFRTLMLPEDYGVDAWDGKITYIVTSSLSTTAGFIGGTGNLSVQTDSASITGVAYVLVSHGKDGGGYYRNGTSRTATTLSAGVEAENWDADSQVVAISHNYSQNTNYFDDIVLWGEVDKIAKLP